MKRKRVITIEVEREVVIKKREHKVRVFCPTCKTEVEVTIPPEMLEEQGEDILSQVVNAVKKQAMHANHIDDSLDVSETMLLPPAGEPNEA